MAAKSNPDWVECYMKTKAERITIKRGWLRKKSSWLASGAVVSVAARHLNVVPA
jgi:hypothetical protein